MKLAAAAFVIVAWLGLGPALAHEPVSATPGRCACDVASGSDGWCDVHGIGHIGGVEIVSERLYRTLDPHGHLLDLDTFECDRCKLAIETNGFCEDHRVGFVDGLVYHSELSYYLARAERRDLSTLSCPVCKTHAQSHGWCETCRVGMVGRSAIHDRADFEAVAEALHLLELANEAAERCERCAVAIVTDSICIKCRLAYEGGRSRPIAPKDN